MSHFEQRIEAMDGKAMIVCMSRRICIDLYYELTRLRPDWTRRGRRQGPNQGRDDGQRFGPAQLAAPYPEQAAPRRPGETIPRCRRSAADRARAGHVADRLRCAESAQPQVIEELIQLARDMREGNARGEALGLSEDELAFYDALETNDSAVQLLGDETLRDIARELVETVRNNVKIDWTLREKRPREPAPAGQAHPAYARLPARQAGEGDADGARTGGGALRWLGVMTPGRLGRRGSERADPTLGFG